MDTTPIVDANVASTKNVLFEVTTISKTLAAFLFIILPFIGGWIGYNFEKPTVAMTTGLDAEPVSNEPNEHQGTNTQVEQVYGLIPLKKEWVYSSIISANQEGIIGATFPYDSTAINLGSGYYYSAGSIVWSGVRPMYGGPSYFVGYELGGSYINYYNKYENERFSVIFSIEGSDLLDVNDTYIIREGEEWYALPSLGGKSLRFLTTLDAKQNTVFYFTDEENVYVMYGNRPYEGCCTIMTKDMFAVVGADLATFEIVDKATARDKNNVYTSTMSEEGRVELSISAR